MWTKGNSANNFASALEAFAFLAPGPSVDLRLPMGSRGVRQSYPAKKKTAAAQSKSQQDLQNKMPRKSSSFLKLFHQRLLRRHERYSVHFQFCWSLECIRMAATSNFRETRLYLSRQNTWPRACCPRATCQTTRRASNITANCPGASPNLENSLFVLNPGNHISRSGRLC